MNSFSFVFLLFSCVCLGFINLAKHGSREIMLTLNMLKIERLRMR